MLVVNERTCVGCGGCQTVCPRDALQAWGILRINQDNCDDCEACFKVCPTDSLSVMNSRKNRPSQRSA